jgi:hypothetical protein
VPRRSINRDGLPVAADALPPPLLASRGGEAASCTLRCIVCTSAGRTRLRFSARAGKHDACSGQQAFLSFWFVGGWGILGESYSGQLPPGALHGLCFLCMSIAFPGLDGVRTVPVRMCYMAASPPRGSLRCICTCQLGRLVGAPCLDGRLSVHHRVERPFLPLPPSWLCIPVPACTSSCAWALFAGQPAPVTPFFSALPTVNRVSGCA